MEQIPIGVEKGFFRMRVRGVRPVLAHPERYVPLARSTHPIETILRSGVLALMDITALTGRYGQGPMRTAERMLEEGVYFAASSDAHRPEDVDMVEWGIERLRALVGESGAMRLLSEHPRQILQGKLVTQE